MEAGGLKRYPEWRDCLKEAIEDEIGKPFKWGEHDCCLVSFGLVYAITGVELFPYQNRYSSLIGLREIGYREFGGALTTEDLATWILGTSMVTDAAGTGDMMCC